MGIHFSTPIMVSRTFLVAIFAVICFSAIAHAAPLDGGCTVSANYEDCQKICQYTSGCGVWTWSGNSSVCYVKAPTGWTSQSSANFVSGNKDGSVIVFDVDLKG